MKHSRTRVGALLLFSFGLFTLAPALTAQTRVPPPAKKAAAKPPAAPAPRLFLIRENFWYGYIDVSGKVVIAPQFVGAEREFTEGLAAVLETREGGWGYIDREGRVVIPFQYEEAEPFQEGRAHVVLEYDDPDNLVGPKRACIDANGTIIFKSDWQYIGQFTSGLAVVGDANSKVGMINRDGEVVIPVKFDGLGTLKEGLAPVRIGAKYGFIDKTGRLVIPAKYARAFDFHEGLASVSSDKKMYGFIDRSGALIVPQRFEAAYAFRNGLAAVTQGEKVGFIDKQGNWVIRPQFYSAGDFNASGRAFVTKVKGEGSFLIDRTGRRASPKVGVIWKLAPGETDLEKGRYQGVGPGGKLVISPGYSHVEGFQDGLARVNKSRLGDHWWYVDETGKVVWKPDETWSYGYDGPTVPIRLSALGLTIAYPERLGKRFGRQALSVSNELPFGAGGRIVFGGDDCGKPQEKFGSFEDRELLPPGWVWWMDVPENPRQSWTEDMVACLIMGKPTFLRNRAYLQARFHTRWAGGIPYDRDDARVIRQTLEAVTIAAEQKGWVSGIPRLPLPPSSVVAVGDGAAAPPADASGTPTAEAKTGSTPQTVAAAPPASKPAGAPSPLPPAPSAPAAPARLKATQRLGTLGLDIELAADGSEWRATVDTSFGYARDKFTRLQPANPPLEVYLERVKSSQKCADTIPGHARSMRVQPITVDFLPADWHSQVVPASFLWACFDVNGQVFEAGLSGMKEASTADKQMVSRLLSAISEAWKKRYGSGLAQ